MASDEGSLVRFARTGQAFLIAGVALLAFTAFQLWRGGIDVPVDVYSVSAGIAAIAAGIQLREKKSRKNQYAMIFVACTLLLIALVTYVF